MEVLDLETNEWSFASPLTGPRHHAGAAAMNGYVFVHVVVVVVVFCVKIKSICLLSLTVFFLSLIHI